MATINKFYEMNSWKLSRKIAKDIYDLISENPKLLRDYPLKDQMKRSCGSIMDNIAEGYGRGNSKEFITFLGYSKGSCTELMSQLFRAQDAGYVAPDYRVQLHGKIDEVLAMNSKLIEYLNSTNIRGSRYTASEPESIYNGTNPDIPPLILF